jgi:hypothetical protein
MAQLTMRRSWLGSIESLSVVYLVIAFAVLTIALGSEGGRIFQGMAENFGHFELPLASPSLESYGTGP